MTTTGMTVAILGPGGVGGLIGALLARDGHRVICLAGDETAAVLRRDGLYVESAQYGSGDGAVDGHFTVPVEADTELREPVDVVFVTVKQTALAAALERVPPKVLGDGIVVPLLNGLDHVAELRRRYPEARVVAGTIRVEATRIAPGRIAHTSPFAALELAAPLEDLAAGLRHAGLDATLRADETALLWDKLSFLAAFALLTTRYRADVGTIREERRAELLAVLEEITAVATAEGAPVSAASVLSFFDRAPGAMKSSMQRDAEAGRPIELDAIGGAVLRAAATHRIETPTIARLVAELAVPTVPAGRPPLESGGTMQQHYVRPEGTPPVNGYSHAVVFTGPMVAVSGQVPVDAQGRLVGEGDAEAQIRQVFANLAAALGAAGAGLEHVVRLTVFLTDLADLDSFRRVRDEYLDTARPPACSLVGVAGLVHPAFRVEIDALAVLPAAG